MTEKLAFLKENRLVPDKQAVAVVLDAAKKPQPIWQGWLTEMPEQVWIEADIIYVSRATLDRIRERMKTQTPVGTIS